MFSLICALINGRVNNGEAGDLRHHISHYEVTVMVELSLSVLQSNNYEVSNSTFIDRQPWLFVGAKYSYLPQLISGLATDYYQAFYIPI